jgi:protein SCO1/2
MKILLKIYAIGLVFIAFVAGADEDPHAHHKQMMNKGSAYGRSVHTYDLGEIDVTLSDGVETTLVDAFADDKPVMVHFIFTTCTTICPVQAATFYQVQHHLGDEASDVQMVSISIDPEYDTPSRLQDYAKKFHAGSQWIFLTGTTDEMIRTQRAFHAYEGGKMNHKPLTLLRAAGSDEWVRLDGLINASDIMKEYRQLTDAS